MGSITHYIGNASLLKKMLAYLETYHGVRVALVDSEGQWETVEGIGPLEGPCNKLFPIACHENIGGIQCAAETDAMIEQAEPHILMCIESLQESLQKDLILKQTTDEMLQLSAQLHFLSNLANKVVGIQNLQRYCTVVLEEIAGAIAADYAFLKAEGTNKKTFSIGHQITTEKAEAMCHDPNFRSSPEGAPVLFSLKNGTSALVAPITGKDNVLGHMAFFRNRDRRFFTSYEKQFVGIVDNIISPSIDSLRLYDSLHELYLNTVRALAAAIDAKDAYTHGHSFRVAKYSVAIGKKLTVDTKSLSDLEMAAYMHDLGKIGVPEAILGKPGKLTDEEFEKVKEHPVLTDKILGPIDLPQFIVDAAVHHHERLDGHGYPDGLKGPAISLFARIIAVADVFDALTSARPYRDAMTVEKAMNILRKGIDTEFDRDVVLALVAALKDKQSDEELAKLYPELQFMNIDKMVHFLEELTRSVLLDGMPDIATAACEKPRHAPAS